MNKKDSIEKSKETEEEKIGVGETTKKELRQEESTDTNSSRSSDS